MGQNELLAIALLVAPIALMLILRTSATFVFLSLCLGFTVNTLLGADIRSFTSTFFPQAGANTIELLLLVLPAFLTAIFMTHSVKGVPRLLLNAIPAVAVGCLAAILIVPLLPADLSRLITSLTLWQQLVRVQSLVVGGGAVISLLFLWLQRSGSNKDGSSKKREG